MEARIYADDYSQKFGNGTEETFLEFLKGSDKRAAWKTQQTKSLHFEALEEGSEMEQRLAEKYREQGKEGVIHDTLAHTKLLLQTEDSLYPVRSCAIKTILDRAQISGGA